MLLCFSILFSSSACILLLQNDAAVYISAVLQHTVERLVAGALTSCDKADFRSEASSHMDVKPRHIQVGRPTVAYSTYRSQALLVVPICCQYEH